MNLPIHCRKPSKEETWTAIRQLKNAKATIPYSIPAEALKADLNSIVEMLYPLFEKIWEEGQVPSDWKEGYLFKIPMKGSLSNFANYRGIMILSTPRKVFNRILLNQM